ncbi:Uncharacterised protein [Mycobacteroides abscessus]|nr:Uncharacterised protein [Mycobacteroides abscessus]
MKTVYLETELPTDADRVWNAMQYAGTFLYLCRGLFGIPALSGRTEPLRVGEAGTAWLWGLHLIPLYRHTIHVVEVDADNRTVRTSESGGILRTWNHTLTWSRLAGDGAVTAIPSILMRGCSAQRPPAARRRFSGIDNGAGTDWSTSNCYRRGRHTRGSRPGSQPLSALAVRRPLELR